ncbi:MAG: hypothetical protein AAF266_01280, partial [Planctomycetota bacterium]
QSEATPPSTESLARLVKQKRRLLEQMVLVGRRQGELIESGDAAALLQLLSGKQQLIAGLQTVEQGLAAFQNDNPEQRVWRSPADRASCKADADACSVLLAESLAMEQQHEAAMTERRDALSKQMQQAQSAHAASTAYKPHLRGPRSVTPTLSDDDSVPLAASLDLTTNG